MDYLYLKNHINIKEKAMSSWALFLLTSFLLGILISSIMLFKQNAKMKSREHIKKVIELKEKP